MPVTALSYTRLRLLVGDSVTKKQIAGLLPFLGLDIESEQGDLVRVEYSPNRPDYSTDVGIALGLQGLIGRKTGPVALDVHDSDKYTISVKPAVSKIRPFVTGIVARRGRVDKHTIKQLVAMQEDLHMGVGRKRVKSSIGIHDMDNIAFPLLYTVAGRSHRFTPLHHDDDNNDDGDDDNNNDLHSDGNIPPTSQQTSLSVSEILSQTDVGRTYGSILGDATMVPVILDSEGRTVSLPPIINAALTTVTTKTRNLFVDVTGTSKKDSEDVLAVIATFLQSAGFRLESVCISGARNSTPHLAQRSMSIDASLVNEMLGTNLSTAEIISSLKRSRLGAVVTGRKSKHNKDHHAADTIICTIPPYRFDIFGPMDLVEEAALGHGIQNLKPVLSPSMTLGMASLGSVRLRSLARVMVGLGYTEALNSNLTSMRVLDPLHNTSLHQGLISTLDSKSSEHTILRNSVLACLLENLSRNIHEPYPQRLFEVGTVFSDTSTPGGYHGDAARDTQADNTQVREHTCLSAISAHAGAGFTETKAVLRSLLHAGLGVHVHTKTMIGDHPILEAGRSATIVTAHGTKIGLMGEISPAVRKAYRIRVPVVGFEIPLISELASEPHLL